MAKPRPPGSPQSNARQNRPADEPMRLSVQSVRWTWNRLHSRRRGRCKTRDFCCPPDLCRARADPLSPLPPARQSISPGTLRRHPPPRRYRAHLATRLAAPSIHHVKRGGAPSGSGADLSHALTANAPQRELRSIPEPGLNAVPCPVGTGTSAPSTARTVRDNLGPGPHLPRSAGRPLLGNLMPGAARGLANHWFPHRLSPAALPARWPDSTVLRKKNWVLLLLST